MSNMNMNTHTSILQTILQFHNIGYTGFLIPLFSNTDEQYSFGTIDVITLPRDPIPYTWDVKFSIDCSASMSDKCRDGRTKLQHITHTLCNILRLFVSYETQVFNVCIHIFNEEINTVIDFITVSRENIDSLIAKISSIYDNGTTNLVNPIKTTNLQMRDRKMEFPGHKLLHFMLTDGLDSCGNSSDKIVNSINSEYETIVLGFGIDHDAKTLSKIGNKPMCSYGFIAEIEKSGIVYGEFIHNVMYRAFTNVTIEMELSEIYSWETNTWSTKLDIGNLACDLKKTFYVRTKQDHMSVSGNLFGIQCSVLGNTQYELLDTIHPIPELIVQCDDTIHPVDLFNHMYRYKTLELLYEANQIDIPSYLDSIWLRHFDESHKIPDKKEIDMMKKKLLEFYIDMRNYTKENYPDGNSFMESLLDDIYICRISFENINARIYSTTRHRTQGNQNVYTPTSIYDVITGNNSYKSVSFADDEMYIDSQLSCSSNDIIDLDIHLDEPPIYNFRTMTPRFTRKTPYSTPTTLGLSADEAIFNNHNITQFTQEAYTSPTLLKIIRSTSDEDTTCM